jgi:hypothetical protein
MGIERRKIESAYGEMRRVTDACDWNRFADLFAEDATFVTSQLPEPICGRENIRTFFGAWPSTIVNHVEWVVIDGNRLVLGWNERLCADAPAYRGFSTLVFNDDGLIESYEGMLDTVAVAAVIEAARTTTGQGSTS